MLILKDHLTICSTSLVLSCKRAFWKVHALTHLSANKRNKAEIYHWVLPVHMFNTKGSWIRYGSLGSGLSSQCKHHSKGRSCQILDILKETAIPSVTSFYHSHFLVVGPLDMDIRESRRWLCIFGSHSWLWISWGYIKIHLSSDLLLDFWWDPDS